MRGELFERRVERGERRVKKVGGLACYDDCGVKGYEGGVEV